MGIHLERLNLSTAAMDTAVGQNRHQKRLTMKELTSTNAIKASTLIEINDSGK